MDQVRLAVIGCGGMARVHLSTVGGRHAGTDDELRPFAERVKLRTCADIDITKAQAYQHSYGADYATDDPQRIFEDKDVDAVLITTWHDTHAPFSLAAIGAGKHVLIEKPMVMTEKECDEVEAAATRAPIKYMVAFRCRFASGARDVKREIPNPENVIACARVNGIWPETSWAQDPIRGGGQILSQGCHIVDLMFYLAGTDVEALYATGGGFHHSRPDIFDTINAAVRFKNGTTGAFLGGDGGTGRLMMHHPAPNGCPFWVLATHRGRSGLAIDHGEDARFESADGTWKPPYESRIYSQEIGGESASGLGNVLPAFARCILQDEPIPATVRDGARVTRFILKCFESARTGEVIRF